MKKSYSTPVCFVTVAEIADILTLSLADYTSDKTDRTSWGIEKL